MKVLYLRYVWLYSPLVKLSGDVEENPGPKPKPCLLNLSPEVVSFSHNK